MWWERLRLWSKGFLLLPMKTMRIPARICLTSTSGEGRVFMLHSCAARHAAPMRGELPADSLPELLCPVHISMHSLACRHCPTRLHAAHLNGTVLDMCSVPQLQRGSQTEAAAAAPVSLPIHVAECCEQPVAFCAGRPPGLTVPIQPLPSGWASLQTWMTTRRPRSASTLWHSCQPLEMQAAR